jgi:uncharacterized membrane protein
MGDIKVIKTHNSTYAAVVLSLITIFTGVLSWICFRRYYCFDYIDMDLAAYNQILWNIVHGSLYSSILGVNFLGHHAHFIFFLLAPLYFFLQSPLTLVFLQIFSLGLAAYPIFLIARDELTEQLGVALVIAYLLYPAMGYTALYEFHVTTFATAFLSFMFYFFIKQEFRLFILFMILSLLCQENIPLVIIPFGIFAFLKKRSLKWWLLPILAAGVWFGLIVGKLMPYLNKDTVQFISIYRHLGHSLPEVAIFIITHPLLVVKMMFTPEKLSFLFKLFGPLCFFPLLDGRILISGLLFLQHLLSIRSPEYMIEYHYDAEILPFMFISAIYGLKRVINWPIIKQYLRPGIISLFLLTVSITCAVSFGPFIEIAVDKHKTVKDDLDLQKERFIKMIPPDASIVATFELLPMLSNRKELYSFHQVVDGFYTLSTKPYVLPAGVEYALLDVNDLLGVTAFYQKGHSEANMANFINSNQWGVVEKLDNIVLLKNNCQSKLKLFETSDALPQGLSLTLVMAKVNDELMFLGYNKGNTREIAAAKTVELQFFYKALKPMKNDYWMHIEINDAKDMILYQNDRPLCYRIFPTYMWEKGEIVKENYCLFIPREISNESFTVKLKLFDNASDQAVPFYIDKPGFKTITRDEIEILKN